MDTALLAALAVFFVVGLFLAYAFHTDYQASLRAQQAHVRQLQGPTL